MMQYTKVQKSDTHDGYHSTLTHTCLQYVSIKVVGYKLLEQIMTMFT